MFLAYVSRFWLGWRFLLWSINLPLYLLWCLYVVFWEIGPLKTFSFSFSLPPLFSSLFLAQVSQFWLGHRSLLWFINLFLFLLRHQCIFDILDCKILWDSYGRLPALEVLKKQTPCLKKKYYYKVLWKVIGFRMNINHWQSRWVVLCTNNMEKKGYYFVHMLYRTITCDY